MWNLNFPDQGLNLHPLHWEHGVLTTGQQGKSQVQLVYCAIQHLCCLTAFHLDNLSIDVSGVLMSPIFFFYSCEFFPLSLLVFVLYI